MPALSLLGKKANTIIVARILRDFHKFEYSNKFVAIPSNNHVFVGLGITSSSMIKNCKLVYVGKNIDSNLQFPMIKNESLEYVLRKGKIDYLINIIEDDHIHLTDLSDQIDRILRDASW